MKKEEEEHIAGINADYDSFQKNTHRLSEKVTVITNSSDKIDSDVWLEDIKEKADGLIKKYKEENLSEV